MRTLTITLLIAAAAAAQDPATDAPEQPVAQDPVLKDGKLTNKAWAFTYEARGLEQGISTLKPNVLFEGRAAGSVQIEVVVLEAPQKKTGKEWLALFKAGMTKSKRKLDNVQESTEGTATLVFTETKLDIFNEEHGYAFHPRGFQCFLVHAYVADKTDKSTARIKECLGGLKLGEDPGAALFVVLAAQRSGLPMDHPMVLLQAGSGYAQQGPQQNLEMAARVLGRARKNMKDDSFTPEQRWSLFETGGYCLLAKKDRDSKGAIDWLSKAVEAAKKLPADQSADRAALSGYNLACAYSLDGQVDKGFEALHQCFAEKMPVNAEHLTKDTDLDNLKKNQEKWDKFWKEKVAGR
ncbi:MAG: TPR end-of-group domain-containing protein [Planctomycetota bacterium]|jgi:hypothetical protein